MDRARLYPQTSGTPGHCGERPGPNAPPAGAVTFQAVSWYANDEFLDRGDDDDGEGADDGSDSDAEESRTHADRSHEYVIKVFGVTADGTAVSTTITSFTPYFYVKLSPMPNSAHQLQLLVRWMRSPHSKLGVRAQDIVDVRVLRKKDFWGFTNGLQQPFVRISCRTQRCMRTLADRLGKLRDVRVPGIAAPMRAQLYESNIDPLLRFFHVRDLRPAGWLRVPLDQPTNRSAANAGQTLASRTKCAIDTTCRWQDVCAEARDEIAPLLIASFDIECSSSHGDFPVAKKDHRKIAQDLYSLWQAHEGLRAANEFAAKELLIRAIVAPFSASDDDDDDDDVTSGPAVRVRDHMSRAFVKARHGAGPGAARQLQAIAKRIVDDVYVCLKGRMVGLSKAASGAEVRASVVASLTQVLNDAFEGVAPLQGDSVIQIGTTFHKYGSRELAYRSVMTLGTCDPIEGVDVVACGSERELLLRWAAMMAAMDPDVVVGWNIFGFDMEYVHDRAEENGCVEQLCRALSRLRDVPEPPRGQRWLREQRLSSSALGDNFLRYIDMHGRTTIDLMKVVQRDHKLDSYKLDFVAQTFLGQRKNDVPPHKIFELQGGGAGDRRVIAEYCVQDCALCNYLTMKLEILANNAGMANVCSVPLAFIFMRGQGVKIFSLVAKQCKTDGFLVPAVKHMQQQQQQQQQAEDEDATDDGYEGAIVLDPKPGIYLDDPVSVLDYASLYPSSMISENLSHDCLVIDPKFDNLPGIEYLTITYEEGADRRTVTCRFAQIEGKGVLPRILMQLLKQRKATRKRMESCIVRAPRSVDTEVQVQVDVQAQDEVQAQADVQAQAEVQAQDEVQAQAEVEELQGFYDAATGEFTDLSGAKRRLRAGLEARDAYSEFQKAVLDGLQLAYKVTANSLYGQMGARTSPLYLKHIAACTTATGRKMILLAKDFLEQNFGANVVYGDTDSIFVIFPKGVPLGASGVTIDERGKAAIMPSIRLAARASSEFKKLLKPPHDLEYEKTFWPWIIFSKKRYVGNVYEFDDKKCKQKSMGIVLKRRDNAHIVKKIYGGCIDIILLQQDVAASIDFLRQSLTELVDGRTSLEDLIVTKTLRAEYKNPEQIAHQVLAQRMGERDPGNKPQVNERVPFVYISSPPGASSKKVLQGDRIEHPDYIREHKIRPDYRFYITNQIMKPVLQLFSLALDKLPVVMNAGKKTPQHWQATRAKYMLEYDGDAEKVDDKLQALREAEVKLALFDPVLRTIDNRASGMSDITTWFKPLPKKEK